MALHHPHHKCECFRILNKLESLTMQKNNVKYCHSHLKLQRAKCGSALQITSSSSIPFRKVFKRGRIVLFAPLLAK
jgi:hypothetical protein